MESLERKTHKCLVCDKEHDLESNRYFCSDACEKRWDTKYLSWDDEHTKESSTGAVCPFCEHEHEARGDYPELYDENSDEMICSNCNKKFKVIPHTTWTWETKPLDDDYPNLEEPEEE